MRHLEVTHTYVLQVDVDDMNGLDTVANAGVSMMEAHMHVLMPGREIQSNWKLMPREYQEGEVRTQGKVPEVLDAADATWTPVTGESLDSDEAKYAIENDLDQGVSFAQDIMGQGEARVTHPWKQGLSIFPEDHPLRAVEDRMRAQNDEEGLELLQAQSPKLRELESGE